MTEEKICPILSAWPAELIPCLKERCMAWATYRIGPVDSEEYIGYCKLLTRVLQTDREITMRGL